MFIRVPCPAPATSSFRAFCCLSGRAGCGPLGPSSTFPVYGLPEFPPHGYRTSHPLPTAQLSPLTLLVLAAQHVSLPVFPPCPTAGANCIQTRSSWTQDLNCSHPWADNAKRDTWPLFQAQRMWEAALAAKPAFPEAPSDAAVL